MLDFLEDDDRYPYRDDGMPGRPRRTKFRPFEDRRLPADRSKRAGKRSHRQKTIKDDFWSGRDD
jgi:hypothetical protein